MPSFPEYVLYKEPVSLETLKIVRYLHSLGIDAKPSVIVERNHPPEVIALPAIYDKQGKEWYVGLDRCCEFYEMCSWVYELHMKASAFSDRVGVEYRINGL